MRRFFPFLAAALLTLGLAGCQQLFTTSLAKSLARDTLPMPSALTPSQASDLAAQAKANDDPRLAGALVSALVAQIKTTADPVVKAELQAAAASAAIVASGIGSAVTDILSSVAADNGALPNEADMIALVAAIKAGASPDVVAALQYLDPGTTPGSTAAAGLGATDLAIAAIVVAAGSLPAATDPTAMTPEQIDAFTASDGAQSAIRIIGEAAAKVEAGSASADLLNGILSTFGLPPT